MGQRRSVDAKDNVTGRQAMLTQPKCLARPAADAVAVHCPAHRTFGNHQAKPGKAGAVVQRDHFDCSDTSASAASEHLLELLRRKQPLLTGEPVRRAGRLRRVAGPVVNQDQTQLIRWRPLARRAFRTLRPPTVRMRARKPCVRARRRLLG